MRRPIVQYPHHVAVTLAGQIASHLSPKWKPLVGASTVEVCDAMDRAFLDADEATPPVGRVIRVEQTQDGQVIHDSEPPLRLRTYLVNPLLLFCLCLTIAWIWIALIEKWLPLSRAPDGAARSAWAFFALLLIVIFLVSRRTELSWIITPELLMQAKGGGRRRLVRPWRRVDIAGRIERAPEAA
jgi:hypothetical protein